MIKLTSVSKAFDQKTVLSGFSLTVNDGEHIAIMGESGCGKTTLLRIIANLEQVDSGMIEGYDSSMVSYVFQESRLFDSLTALDNVACVSTLPYKEARPKALVILEKLGLRESAKLYPAELSGGMAQRVSIARAMMANTPILLLDEPFSALDDATRAEVIEILSEFTKDKTLILVTHSRCDAELLATRIIELGLDS